MSRTELLLSWYVRAVLAVLLLTTTQVFSATLNFNNSGSLPALKASGTCATWNNEWEYDNGEFSCNAQVTFASGDLIRTTRTSVIIRGNAGITVNNNSVGTTSNRVNLTTTYGPLQVSASSTVYGNLQASSGAITVQNSTVNGTITSSGALTLNAASVSGTINSSGTGSITNGSTLGGAVTIGNGLTNSGSTFNSTLTVTNGSLNTSNNTYHGNVTVNSHIISNNDVFLANVTSTNGRLEFTGGSVTGLIYTPCCTLTTNNTNLAGGATVQSGISITGGTISGDYTMTSNNPAVVNNVTMTSGSITSASTVTINNSTLGSDTSPVLVTSVSGSITVNNSEVYGDLVTPDYDKVYVNGGSEVVGSCIPVDEPLYACGGVATVTRDSYWRFDEVLWNGSTGEVKDSSLEAKHGRAVNSAVVAQLLPSPASCTYGDFQATGSSSHPFVDIARNSYFHNSDEFGFTLWLKMSATAQASGSQTIMAYGGAVSGTAGRFQLTRESGGNLRFSVRMTGGGVRYVETSGTAIFNDQWQHIAFSYSKNNRRMRLYVNNQLVDGVPDSSISDTTSAKTPNDGIGNFAIGALPDGTAGIRGQIDEVRFFDRELLTSDIKNMYEQVATCINECFTENFANDTNWYLTQRNSTPPSLKTSPNRLRLTENTLNQSTSITFKRSFPAAGNKMTIEFDHYAYGGTGADGIALVLSDAAVTPVPGSYGGSLGYAQRTNVSPAQSGFSGGWLGIGFDEFGNFSQATEGRVGGTSARPQAIGVRAASSTNYGWLGGTNTLSPTLSASGSTLARGDRYRITIDSRISSPQTVSFQLERRLAGGSSYSTLLTSSNLLSLGQPAPPANLLLSYTGSTGDNTNFHEITNIQVCTQQPSAPVELGDPVHHYELVYANKGLTCEAEAIQVKACANADCSTLVADSVSTVLSATNNGTFVGGNNITFTGSTTVYLRQTNLGDTTLSLSGAPNPTVCSTSGCKINFSHAGFKFYATDNSTNGLLNQVAGVQGGGFLRAVKTNTNTMACEARTVGTRNVTLSYDCLNPGSCSTDFEDVLELKNNSAGATTKTSFDGDEEGDGKTVSLTFRSDGYAPLGINYFDVGQIRLSASLSLAASGNDPAVTLAGQSDAFVVRPYQINVTTALSSATADPANATNPQTLDTGAGFIAAGEAFQLYVSPVNAQGNLTPNYGNESGPETVAVDFGQLLHPASGSNGILTPGGAFTKVTNGTYSNRFHSTGFSWNEVGTISLLARVKDDDYLGTGSGAELSSTPYTVGRFFPKHYTLANSSFGNTCADFSYMGQPAMTLAYELQAKNVAGAVTQNYGPGYGVLTVPSVVLENDDSGTDLSGRTLVPASSWASGKYTFSQSNLSFSKLTTPDGPYSVLMAGIKITDTLDGRDLEVKSMNPTSSGACGVNCIAAAVSGTLDMRFGRLFINSGIGDENEKLRVMVETQYWNGNNFVRNVQDNCTSFDPTHWSAVKAAEPAAPSAPVSIQLSGEESLLVDGVTDPTDFWIDTPGVRSKYILQCAGTITECIKQSWLHYDWNGDNVLDADDFDAGAEFIFGLRTGNKRQIFWQERLN